MTTSKVHFMAFSIALLGCNLTDGPQTSQRIPVQSTAGTSFLFRDHTLCEAMPHMSAGGGVYRVLAMESAMEKHDRESIDTPHTYVTLKLEQAWTDRAPARPTLRMRGGAMPGGRLQSTTIALSVGESVALLLDRPTSPGGFYGIDPLGVFRPDPETGELSNSMHSLGASAAAASARIRSIHGKVGSDCRRNDVMPRALRSSAPVSGPARPDVEQLGTKRLGDDGTKIMGVHE